MFELYNGQFTLLKQHARIKSINSFKKHNKKGGKNYIFCYNLSMKNKFIQNGVYLDENMWDIWLRSTTEYVFFKDVNGMYLAFSDAAAELGGFDKKDAIGKYDYELYPTYLAQTFLKQDKEVLSTKKSITFKNVMSHPEKGEIIVEGIKSPLFNAQGEIIGLQGISRDITDRQLVLEKFKQEQSKLQALLDNIPVAVWLKDSENKYITINKEYEKLFEVKKEDIIGNNVSETLQENKLFTENELSLLKSQVEYIYSQSKKSKLEFCMITNGRKSCYEFIKAPIIRNDRVIGLVGICNDITDKMH